MRSHSPFAGSLMCSSKFLAVKVITVEWGLPISAAWMWMPQRAERRSNGDLIGRKREAGDWWKGRVPLVAGLGRLCLGVWEGFFRVKTTTTGEAMKIVSAKNVLSITGNTVSFLVSQTKCYIVSFTTYQC